MPLEKPRREGPKSVERRKPPEMKTLSHLNERGEAHMVDVGEKPSTRRIATAAGSIRMAPETLLILQKGDTQKGDALAVARVAAIQAVKETSRAIPLCHPLPITAIQVAFEADTEHSRVHVQVSCKVHGSTGVEMEALHGTSVALLTLYDMLKAVDKGMSIEGIRVVSKTGGKSDSVYTDPLLSTESHES